MNLSALRLSRPLAGLLCLLPLAAQAHVGAPHDHGFLAGFAHPLGGLDHLLAMVAVGVWSAQQGGRALWALPVAFVTMLLAGGALGIAGVELPYIEQGIQMSLLVLGLAVVLSLRVAPAIGALLVGGFALFHGHAHGSEMAAGTAALAYCAGFALATGALHALGIAGTLALARNARARLFERIAGAGVALAGGWFALG